MLNKNRYRPMKIFKMAAKLIKKGNSLKNDTLLSKNKNSITGQFRYYEKFHNNVSINCRVRGLSNYHNYYPLSFHTIDNSIFSKWLFKYISKKKMPQELYQQYIVQYLHKIWMILIKTNKSNCPFSTIIVMLDNILH